MYEAYHSMRREATTDNDHLCAGSVTSGSEQVILGQSDVKVCSAVRQGIGKSLRLRSSLVVIRRIKSLYTVLRRVFDVRSNIVVRVRVRTGDKHGT